MATQNLLTNTAMIELSEVNDVFPDVVARVSSGKEHVLITRDGVPVAALVSVDDLQRLEQLDREWAETTHALERFSAAFADVPVEDLEAEADRIIAEGRVRDAEERRSA